MILIPKHKKVIFRNLGNLSVADSSLSLTDIKPALLAVAKALKHDSYSIEDPDVSVISTGDLIRPRSIRSSKEIFKQSVFPFGRAFKIRLAYYIYSLLCEHVEGTRIVNIVKQSLESEVDQTSTSDSSEDNSKVQQSADFPQVNRQAVMDPTLLRAAHSLLRIFDLVDSGKLRLVDGIKHETYESLLSSLSSFVPMKSSATQMTINKPAELVIYTISYVVSFLIGVFSDDNNFIKQEPVKLDLQKVSLPDMIAEMDGQLHSTLLLLYSKYQLSQDYVDLCAKAKEDTNGDDVGLTITATGASFTTKTLEDKISLAVNLLRVSLLSHTSALLQASEFCNELPRYLAACTAVGKPSKISDLEDIKGSCLDPSFMSFVNNSTVEEAYHFESKAIAEDYIKDFEDQFSTVITTHSAMLKSWFVKYDTIGDVIKDIPKTSYTIYKEHDGQLRTLSFLPLYPEKLIRWSDQYNEQSLMQGEMTSKYESNHLLSLPHGAYDLGGSQSHTTLDYVGSFNYGRFYKNVLTPRFICRFCRQKKDQAEDKANLLGIYVTSTFEAYEIAVKPEFYFRKKVFSSVDRLWFRSVAKSDSSSVGSFNQLIKDQLVERLKTAYEKPYDFYLLFAKDDPIMNELEGDISLKQSDAFADWLFDVFFSTSSNPKVEGMTMDVNLVNSQNGRNFSLGVYQSMLFRANKDTLFYVTREKLSESVADKRVAQSYSITPRASLVVMVPSWFAQQRFSDLSRSDETKAKPFEKLVRGKKSPEFSSCKKALETLVSPSGIPGFSPLTLTTSDVLSKVNAIKSADLGRRGKFYIFDTPLYYPTTKTGDENSNGPRQASDYKLGILCDIRVSDIEITPSNTVFPKFDVDKLYNSQDGHLEKIEISNTGKFNDWSDLLIGDTRLLATLKHFQDCSTPQDQAMLILLDLIRGRIKKQGVSAELAALFKKFSQLGWFVCKFTYSPLDPNAIAQLLEVQDYASLWTILHQALDHRLALTSSVYRLTYSNDYCSVITFLKERLMMYTASPYSIQIKSSVSSLLPPGLNGVSDSLSSLIGLAFESILPA